MGALNAFYKGFKAEVSTWAVSPTMVQSSYRSNLTDWNNSSFALQNINRFFSEYAFRKKKFDLIPSLTYNAYTNYIYFNEAGKVSQHDKILTQLQPKLGLRFNLWKIHIYNEFQYNLVNNKDILQMPPVVNAAQLFVEAWLFKRATLLQVGFDVLYRSGYQANGYNPLIQQYYVTTRATGVSNAMDYNYMDGYFVVDFFVNMQIRTARLFIKMSNLTTNSGHGYYSTPTYTAIPRTVDFGISWRFFD